IGKRGGERGLVRNRVPRDIFVSDSCKRAQGDGRRAPQIRVVAQIDGGTAWRCRIKRDLAIGITRESGDRINTLAHSHRQHWTLQPSAAAACEDRPSAVARIAVSAARRCAAARVTFWYDVQRTKSSVPSPE